MRIDISLRKMAYTFGAVTVLQVGSVAFQVFGPPVTDIRRAARQVVEAIPEDQKERVISRRQPIYFMGLWETPLKVPVISGETYWRWSTEMTVVRHLEYMGALSTPQGNAHFAAQEVVARMTETQVRLAAGTSHNAAGTSHNSDDFGITPGFSLGSISGVEALRAKVQMVLSRDFLFNGVTCGVSLGQSLSIPFGPPHLTVHMQESYLHASRLPGFVKKARLGRSAENEVICQTTKPNNELGGSYHPLSPHSLIYLYYTGEGSNRHMAYFRTRHSRARSMFHERNHHRFNGNIEAWKYYAKPAYRSDAAIIHIVDEANAHTLDVEASRIMKLRGEPLFWGTLDEKGPVAFYDLMERVYGKADMETYMGQHGALPPLIKRQLFAFHVTSLIHHSVYKNVMRPHASHSRLPAGTVVNDDLIHRGIKQGEIDPYGRMRGISGFIRHNTAAAPEAHSSSLTADALLAQQAAKSFTFLFGILADFRSPQEQPSDTLRCRAAAFVEKLSDTPDGFGTAHFLLEDMRELVLHVRTAIAQDPQYNAGQRRFRLPLLDDMAETLTRKLGQPSAPTKLQTVNTGRCLAIGGGGG